MKFFVPDTEESPCIGGGEWYFDVQKGVDEFLCRIYRHRNSDTLAGHGYDIGKRYYIVGGREGSLINVEIKKL